MKRQPPQWQPISMLPTFTDMIDRMLASSLDQLTTMREAAAKPHTLDDATLNRILDIYSDQLNDHWLFEEQFARWAQGRLSIAEAEEVSLLIDQTLRLKETNESILQIAHSIELATIDKITGMDDAKLAMKVLWGQIRGSVARTG